MHTVRRVEFNDCDPHRHMASAAFLAWIVDHRFTAIHECFGADVFDLPETTGVAWVIREVHLDFRQEAVLGEVLRVESWLEKFLSYRMEVQVRITKVATGEICCLATLRIIAVDVARNSPVRLPPALPCRQPVDFSRLPWAEGHPKQS